MSIFQKGTLDPAHGPVNPTPSSSRVQGVDIYHDDDVTSFAALKAAGFDFAYMKSSQGTLNTDVLFHSRMPAARAAGLIVGAYHFMSFHSRGVAQAAHCAAVIKGVLGDDDLPVACDWEYPEGVDGKPADASIAREFLVEIENLTGRRPIIYTTKGIPAEVGAPSWMNDYPLWLADLESNPHPPHPFTGWSFWQHSWAAQVPGIGNEADVNYFNGNIDDLRRFIKTSKV